MGKYKDFFLKSFKLEQSIGKLYKKKHNKNPKKSKTQKEIDLLGNILISYAIYYLKKHNPSLDYKEHYSFIDPFNINPNIIITIMVTKTNTNHPYMIYSDISTSTINFIIPFGNGAYQVDTPYLDSAVANKELKKVEYLILFLFFQQNILVRKNTMIRIDQFSLLSCHNISNCTKKMNEINRMKISQVKKKELKEKYIVFYQDKAVKFLMKYFALLEDQDYQEAFLFLRGERGKYKGKERLNTFFKNSKNLVGHLQVFINLYKYMFKMKEGFLSN